MKLPIREFDAVVIGAGGAGMCAMLQISQSGQTYVLFSKVFPTRSHTISTQGGATVALDDTHEDNWERYIYDTVKGLDYIGDQNTIKCMCKTRPEVILELEYMGLPLPRLDDGCIYQRLFDGQSKNFGGEQTVRTAVAADRTSRTLLHTPYQQDLKDHIIISSEWYVLDLVKNQNDAVMGCTALCIETGGMVYFEAHATVLATGGAGHIHQSTANVHINTGDNVGMAIRAGVPVQDMEMQQFYPADIVGAGILAAEGCHDEDGYLLNKHGERSMERYASNTKDLAGRDMVARFIMIGIREGRDRDGPWGPRAKLKLDHLGKEVFESRLPNILKPSRTLAHVDPVKESIPVTPTCHYMMGSIPTKITGQALAVNEKGEDVVVPGLFAVGEIVCVSVHGANRLGGNSLLDLVVFSRATGLYLQEPIAKQGVLCDASKSNVEASLDRLNRWNSNRNGEDSVAIREALQECVQHNFSVFREGNAMAKGLEQLKVIRERLKSARLDDTSSEFNTQRVECLKLDSLMGTVYATAVSASLRIESHGTHSRFDFPDRDDENWLYHFPYLPESESMTCRSINMKSRLRPASPPEICIYWCGDGKMRLEFSTYRYNPDVDDAPCMQDYTPGADEGRDMMLLGTLIQLKEKDPNLSLRRSCHEGVCGSDGLNMNDKNDPVCITPISALNQPDEETVIRPLPGLLVICDLVVDMGQFHAQYEKVRPYLLNNRQNPPVREHLQMPEQREKLDGPYECILCTCCPISCPSFWWSPNKFIGPAGLLAVYRFLIGSRDIEAGSHLGGLSDAFSVSHCHNIISCVSTCPEGLNPTHVIGHIKSMLLQHNA